MNNNKKALIYAAISILSWSTVATAFKVALRELTTFEMLLIACLTSLFIFTLLITFQRKWGIVKKLTFKEWSIISGLGLLNPVLYYIVLFKAYDLLPAQIAQPINYFWPILLTIMLAVYLKQRIPLNKYVGMVISFIGVICISVGGKQNVEMNIPISGLVLALSSAFIWALYWLVSNKIKLSNDNIILLFGTFLFGSLYMLIGSIFIDVNITSLNGLLSGIYIGLFEMGIPFIFFGMAIRYTNNHALIDQLCYLSPFMSLFIISIVLGEHILPSTYIGLCFIIAGIIYNQYLADKLGVIKNKVLNNK